jgi:hypothetical protein
MQVPRHPSHRATRPDSNGHASVISNTTPSPEFSSLNPVSIRSSAQLLHERSSLVATQPAGAFQSSQRQEDCHATLPAIHVRPSVAV